MISHSKVAQRKRIHLPKQEMQFNPWVGKIPWRGKWHPTQVFLLEKSHGQRSLAGYSLPGHKESGTTEHTSLLLIWSHTGCPSYIVSYPAPQKTSSSSEDLSADSYMSPQVFFSTRHTFIKLYNQLKSVKS